MGCFSICWLPYFAVACAQIFDAYKTTSIFYRCAFSLAMSNSVLNPIIYSWKNSNFRKAFVQLLQCKSPNCYQKSFEEGNASKSSPNLEKRYSMVGSVMHMTINEGGCISGAVETPSGPQNISINFKLVKCKLPTIYTIPALKTTNCLALH